MNVTLFKSLLNGSVDAISSKSYTHRYLIASMLSNNKSTIIGTGRRQLAG